MSMPEFPSNGLTLASLFAGCGGSSLGYKMAGYDVRLAVDWDPKAASTYRANFPGTPFWEGDIAALSGAEALCRAGVVVGELDVLDGSPPCQGFSTAGTRRFLDGRNLLFREYVRLLSVFRPRAFIMENVGGLVKGKMRLLFAEITAALKAEGYRVSCRLLNAWWWGVPQDRRRLIWVGLRGDLGLEPSHPFPRERRPVTVGEALGEQVAALETNQNYHRQWKLSTREAPALTASRAPLLVERHPGYRDTYFREGPAPTLSAGRKTRVVERHNLQVLEAWEAAAALHRARPFVGSFQSHRLDPGKASPTQIAAHRNWRWDEPRYLTVEEAKVLHGYPAWFQVRDYPLIGNSVPPPMAEAVGRHVAALLGGSAGG